jgi:hypothetical protein
VKEATSTDDPWPPDLVKRASALAREFMDAAHPAAAVSLLAGLVRSSAGIARSQYLFDPGIARREIQEP